MLKISQVGPVNHAITLRLEGRVVGPWIAELREACAKVMARGHALNLDMAEVLFLDQASVALLSDLKERGVGLVHCSPFVAEELKAAGKKAAE